MIKKYTWSDAIATGDPIIDLQHKQFFVNINIFPQNRQRHHLNPIPEHPHTKQRLDTEN